MAVTGTMTKRAFLDTPDGQIHYIVAGAGEPILLLHQTPTSSDEYAEMVSILARTKLVVAMDTIILRSLVFNIWNYFQIM